MITPPDPTKPPSAQEACVLELLRRTRQRLPRPHVDLLHDLLRGNQEEDVLHALAFLKSVTGTQVPLDIFRFFQEDHSTTQPLHELLGYMINLFRWDIEGYFERRASASDYTFFLVDMPLPEHNGGLLSGCKKHSWAYLLKNVLPLELWGSQKKEEEVHQPATQKGRLTAFYHSLQDGNNVAEPTKITKHMKLWTTDRSVANDPIELWRKHGVPFLPLTEIADNILYSFFANIQRMRIIDASDVYIPILVHTSPSVNNKGAENPQGHLLLRIYRTRRDTIGKENCFAVQVISHWDDYIIPQGSAIILRDVSFIKPQT